MTGWKKIDGSTIDLDDATFDMSGCKATFVVIGEDRENTEDDTAEKLASALSQAVDVLEMVTLASLSPLAIKACVKNGREALEAYRRKEE